MAPCSEAIVEAGVARVFVGAYDDAGRLRAVVDSDDDYLCEWALEQFRSVRADATRLDDD